MSHVTRAPLLVSKGQMSRSTGRFTQRGLNAQGSCSGQRQHGNILGVGNYCYVAVCSAELCVSAPTEGGEGRGHIVAAARLQPVIITTSIAASAVIKQTHAMSMHWQADAMRISPIDCVGRKAIFSYKPQLATRGPPPCCRCGDPGAASRLEATVRKTYPSSRK